MRLAALVLLRLTIRPYHCCLSPQWLLHLHPPQQRQWYCLDNKGIPRCYWPPPPLHRPHRMICSLPGRNGNQSPLVWLCVGLELSRRPLGITAILLVEKKVSFDVVSGRILWGTRDVDGAGRDLCLWVTVDCLIGRIGWNFQSDGVSAVKFGKFSWHDWNFFLQLSGASLIHIEKMVKCKHGKGWRIGGFGRWWIIVHSFGWLIGWSIDWLID